MTNLGDYPDIKAGLAEEERMMTDCLGEAHDEA